MYNLRENHIFFIGISVIFLFFKASLCLKANDFPVKLDCKNNICNCIKDKTKSFIIDSVIKKLQTHYENDTAILACVYHQLAVEYYKKYDDPNAIKYNKQAMSLRQKFNDGWLWKSQYNLGRCHLNMRNFKETIHYLEKANNQIGYPKRPKDSLTLYTLLARSYEKIGEIDKAIEIAKKAISIKSDKQRINEALVIYSEILIRTNNTLNLLNAIKCLDSLSNEYTLNKGSFVMVDVKNLLGLAFDKMGYFDEAIQQYDEALKFEESNTYKAMLLNNIAVTYLEKKDFINARSYFDKALRLKIKFFQNKFNYQYAPNYENFGDYFINQNHLDSALLNYQKALINLTNKFRNEDIYQNPNPKDTSLFIYSNPDIIRVLHLKATAAYQYYQQNQNPKYLELANQTYQTAFNFHDKLQKDISSENSRLFQAKNIVPYIENALKIIYQQHENGQDISKIAFRFMEKNKATVLLQSMNEADALQFANLPDSLLEQERDLKIAITYHNKQLNEAIEYEDTTEVERLNNLLFEEKQQYNQLINHLENNYPAYYRLKYQQNQTQLADVQNTLDNRTALLEYFVGDSTIYILSVQQGQSKLYQVNKPTDWQQTIENFRQSLTLKDSSQSDSLDVVFVQSAAKIYDWLLKEVLTDLTDDITTLQIIPDGVLNYIPFGVLLSKIDTSQKVDYKTLPYLLKEKAVGYSYSSALWLEQQEGELATKDKITYAGFAPKYGVETGQFKLPFANESVKENADLFNGKAFVENQATGSQFKKSAPQFNILQLAMHVLMDDKKPMETQLLFNQTKDSLSAALRAADLYNMQLKTNLAVLGACNTGSGQLQNGEGVMSLSRAFTYAGTSSLVMSLWSIVDESTAVIVNQFFKNIKEGTPKHRALQQAKLHFLDNAFEDKSHPKYWAGLVVSGNQKALVNKTNYLWWALFAALLCAMGFGLMRSKS